MRHGALDTILLERIRSFAHHRVFLCGDPGLVTRLKRRTFLAGARLQDIHADPFVVAPDVAQPTIASMA